MLRSIFVRSKVIDVAILEEEKMKSKASKEGSMS